MFIWSGPRGQCAMTGVLVSAMTALFACGDSVRNDSSVPAVAAAETASISPTPAPTDSATTTPSGAASPASGIADPADPAPDPGQEKPDKPAFDVAYKELLDIGLGEVLTYEIQLKANGTNLQKARLVSSCDCLSARFVDPPTADTKVATVEVKIDAFETEDIDGTITLQMDDNRVLAEHVARILITMRAFVQPRVVYLSPPYNQEITITIGHAFELGSETDLIPEEPVMDEEKYSIADIGGEPTYAEHHVIQRFDWVIQRLEGAGEPAEGEEIQLSLLEPAATLTVAIKAKKKGKAATESN